MNERELADRRRRLATIAASQRLQLQADISQLRASISGGAAGALRRAALPVAALAGAGVLLSLLACRRRPGQLGVRRARSRVASLVGLAAMLPLARRASSVLQLWRVAREVWPRRADH